MLKLVIVLTVFILPIVYGCPSAQKLRPCECIGDYNSREQIICPGLENEQTLIDVMHAFQITKSFYSFTIKDSNFRFLPHDIFKGVKFQEFKIVSSMLMSLTDLDFAFEGLEEDLTSLIIANSMILNTWEWSALKNLKKLLKLSIAANMLEVSKDIALLKCTNLKDISFANNKITYVHDAAFSEFKKVLSISLRNNLIRDVKRSMMPDPAPMLNKLDLGYNVIQQLPINMFVNMPSLTTLNLDSNRLLTINEKPFNDVWARLQYFDAVNNLLRCDCRMIWITRLKKPQVVNAVCDQPLHLKGMNLLKLTEKDLWC